MRRASVVQVAFVVSCRFGLRAVSTSSTMIVCDLRTGRQRHSFEIKVSFHASAECLVGPGCGPAVVRRPSAVCGLS
jgi:hypothetical protein